VITPEQLRFSPFPLPEPGTLDFVEGLRTVAGFGSAGTKTGLAIHVFGFGKAMSKRAFYSADGDMLIGGSDVVSLDIFGSV
jgi:homogentisate 1,2-dioxygenase